MSNGSRTLLPKKIRGAVLLCQRPQNVLAVILPQSTSPELSFKYRVRYGSSNLYVALIRLRAQGGARFRSNKGFPLRL